MSELFAAINAFFKLGCVMFVIVGVSFLILAGVLMINL